MNELASWGTPVPGRVIGLCSLLVLDLLTVCVLTSGVNNHDEDYNTNNNLRNTGNI